MNASACASTDNRIQWAQIIWTKCKEVVRKLQVRIVKAQQLYKDLLNRLSHDVEVAFECLSRVKGNFHARFLGELAPVTGLAYPTGGPVQRRHESQRYMKDNEMTAHPCAE